MEELEKSIIFYGQHGPAYAEDMAEAVLELAEVYKRSRALRKSQNN